MDDKLSTFSTEVSDMCNLILNNNPYPCHLQLKSHVYQSIGEMYAVLWEANLNVKDDKKEMCMIATEEIRATIDVIDSSLQRIRYKCQ